MGLFDKYSDLVGKKEIRKEIVKQPVNKEIPPAKKEVVKKEQPKEDTQKKSGSFNLLLSIIKLFVMIKKDLKLLIRSKTSALIVLFGPLAIIMLVGLAFNTSSLYNLRVATYSESYSELSDSIVASLQDQQYSVSKVNSTEICQNGVKYGDFHLCVIFPKDLNIGSEDNTIQIHVDQSRTNLASLITNTITDKVAAKSKELGIDITTDIIGVFETTKKAIEQKVTIINKLISDNSDSSLKIQTSESDLNKIDLTFDKADFNFTDVNAKIKAITDKYNLSLVMVNNLKTSVKDVEMSVNSLNAKLSEASSSRSKTVDDLVNTRKMLSSSLTELGTLRTDLNAMVANINSIKVTQAGLIVEPIKTSVQPITQEKRHLSFLFPTMVVLVIMFISVLLSSTVVIREKISLAYFRNFITPTSDILYMIGTYLTNIIIVMLQLCILFAVALYFMKEQLIPLAASLAFVILIIASVFIMLGMAIGYIFKTEETSTLAAISISSIFLLFSNTILPLESLPNGFREIIKYNPFVISENMVKKILLFGIDLNMLMNSIYILLSFFAILFIVAYVAREMTKRSI